MRKLKIVQIGLGHDHAKDVLDTVLDMSDVFEVVGFAVPPSEENDFSDRVAFYRDTRHLTQYTVEELLKLPDVDGATVETEEINLVTYAQMAAERGWHVHMDKPGGLDFAAFEALANTLRDKRLAFSLGYMYRFNPIIAEAIEKVESGALGDIYSVEAHMDCEHVPAKRQWLDRFPGGMLFFLGCHLIDLIYRIQGEPQHVLPLSTSTGTDGVTAQDLGMVAYQYKNGVSFAKCADVEAGGFMRRQLVICGSRGTIEIRPIEYYISEFDQQRRPVQNLQTDVREVRAGGAWGNDGVKSTSAPINRYEAMMTRFAALANGAAPDVYDYDYEIKLFRLLLKSCGKDV